MPLYQTPYKHDNLSGVEAVGHSCQTTLVPLASRAVLASQRHHLFSCLGWRWAVKTRQHGRQSHSPMAEARRQNRGDTDSSARASAASKTAECQRDRDAAQNELKYIYVGKKGWNMKCCVCDWGSSWQSKAVCPFSQWQHFSRCGDGESKQQWWERALCHMQNGCIFLHHRAALGPGVLLHGAPCSCTRWHPERLPDLILLRDVNRKKQPRKIWQIQA